MGWTVSIPPDPKPGPEEELKRLQPLQLPVLNMFQWKKDHPWYRFQKPAHGWDTEGEVSAKLAVTVGLEVLGHYVKVLAPVGWVHLGYEFLEIVIELAGQDEKAREAQVQAWNSYMWQMFWANERAIPSSDLREAAFDALVGDNANHGIVPRLTEAAELRRQELIFAVNARWLADLEVLGQAKKYLDMHGPDAAETKASFQAQAAEARKNAELYVLMDPARAERERRQAQWFEGAIDRADDHLEPSQEIIDSYNADVKAVLELEANPANWELTPEQKAMLHDLKSEMPEPPAFGPEPRPR